ncbi:RING-type E3 ubiquitin transferase [Sarracenia purpurea var. burkii]
MSNNPFFNRTRPELLPERNMELDNSPSKGYALSGKIMLSAILILFAVVVFMVCLHLYARWFLFRERRRHLRRRNRRRTHLVFYVEPDNPNSATVTAAAPGLDASVLNSLPVFVYSSSSSKTHPNALECAVCLSEFEENEKGRLLPKCNHCFHTECIDMWFHSHSTCPLCRSPVHPVPEIRSDTVVSVGEPGDEETGSSSGLCAACQHEDDDSMASSSVAALSDRRKGFEMARVTIEVPRRTESGSEFGPSSPASQGFKSPASRLLSLKRILSMNRRGAAISPSSGMASRGCASPEVDIESGRNEATQ